MASPIAPSLFEFLSELAANNNREWFNENKTRFTDLVQTPSLHLIEQLGKKLTRSCPMLRCEAKKTGGALMRIYRDTRFSKDKTPYKTHVGISLRHEAESDIHAPGIYIHLSASESFVGAGCWRPPREALKLIRASIDQEPLSWKRASQGKKFLSTFEMAGERLKTSPRDYPRDHAMIDEIRRIDFIGISSLTQDDVISDDFVNDLVERIRKARPLMRFLCESIGIPY